MLDPSAAAAEASWDLYKLVWFPSQDWTNELAAVALEETWDDRESGRPGILFNYFSRYTRQIIDEGLWAEASSSSGAKIAAFDTGLLSRHFEPIYGVFEENHNAERQPWVHKEWASPASSKLRLFDVASLQRALFFSDPAEVVYDPRLAVVPNLDHIIGDNVDRYPESLRDNPHIRTAALERAIKIAAARARTNWRLAAAQFYWPPYSDEGRIQLLLPLALVDADTVDLALVLDRDPPYAQEPEPAGACYRAYTVLPLDWAYRNARLITRPEAYWLDINTKAEVERQPRALEN
jgi:hypothetical protein